MRAEFRRWVSLVVIALCSSVSAAVPGTAPAGKTDTHVVIVPEARVVKTLEELRIYGQGVNFTHRATTADAQLEVRSSDCSKVLGNAVMRWPLPGVSADLPDEMVIAGGIGITPGPEGRADIQTTFRFSEKQRQQLALADGTYSMAWMQEGKRLSNVVQFTIDKNHDMKTEPLLTLRPLELEPGGDTRRIAITAVRSRQEDPAVSRIQLMLAQLEVDGVALPRTGAGGSTPGPLRVGERATQVIELKVADLSKPVSVVAKVQAVESAAVKVDGGTPLGDAWDKAKR